jgi:hypothetical protein
VLNRLAPAQTVIAALGQPPEFVAALRGAGEDVLAYRLRVLLRYLRCAAVAQRLVEGGGCAGLAEMVFRHRTAFRGIAQVLNLLRALDDPNWMKRAPTLIPRLFELFPALGKLKFACISVLDKFMTPTGLVFTEVCQRNEALFEAVIAELEEECSAEFVASIARGITDPTWLVTVCLRTRPT